MIETIEQPFSTVEQASVRIGDIEVPEQFYKDAERAGTEYFMNDGQPLIDRKEWDAFVKTLRNDAKSQQKLTAFRFSREPITVPTGELVAAPAIRVLKDALPGKPD